MGSGRAGGGLLFVCWLLVGLREEGRREVPSFEGQVSDPYTHVASWLRVVGALRISRRKCQQREPSWNSWK
jgi:hypothetical protein